MIGKIFILTVLLLGSASAQNYEEFMAKIKAHRNFADNPCAEHPSGFFADNPRGCRWFYECGADNVVVRENRCGEGHNFNELAQACDATLECEDPAKPKFCPTGTGIQIIPHPYSCAKFTSELFFLVKGYN